MNNTAVNSLVSDHLNAFVLYGGQHVRRIDVIRHLRTAGIAERSIGHFTLQVDVALDAEQAAWADAEWARTLRIEDLEAEGMTFSDAQAVLMAEEMGAAA
jgi:hypothetical protein